MVKVTKLRKRYNFTAYIETIQYQRIIATYCKTLILLDFIEVS